MSRNTFDNNNRNNRKNKLEKPAWMVERERDLARKKRIGEIAIGAAAAVLIGIILSRGMKTSEIMDDEERAKNVKRIEAEGVVFHGGVNARKEPFVDNIDSNWLANIGEVGESVAVDYDSVVYYYDSGVDANGGWYGFETAQLSEKLLEGNYISRGEAKNMGSDEKYGDGTVWFNEGYVTVIVGSDETNQESSVN